MPIDHTSFSESGAPKLGENLDRRWWLLKGDQMVDSITATIRALQVHQQVRQMQHTVSARLYGNVALMGQSGVSFRMQAANPTTRERISYNVVQSATDTVTAKIGKNKPKPMFLTSGGDFKAHRKAKKLNQFVEGVFYENEAYKHGPYYFRDGAVFGDGIAHVFAKKTKNGKRVAYERCMPGELWVDEMEAFYGFPRQMHRIKDVDKAVLIDRWPKMADKIREAEGGREDWGTQPNVSDMVRVRESWHLPSGPGAKDGRHCITIGNALLAEEEWGKDFFPFARFRWCPRLYGYWSQGGAEQVQNLQFELNKLLRTVQQSFHMAGTFKVFLENGSKIVKEHLNNDIGAIVNYTGTKPDYYVPQIVPPEIFNHILTLKQLAFEQFGVSMLSAASQKPAGLNAGVALREYNDIESDRFMTIGQAYENFFMDLGRLSIETVQDIVEETGKDYELDAPRGGSTTSLSWNDCKLDADSYIMQAFPVSSLPNTPAERMQTVQEWVQAGWLTPRQGKRLMDFPDLQAVEGLASAEEDWLAEVLDKIVDEGKFTAPEPMDDLNMAREMALQYYAQGKVHHLEEGRLEMLRQFMVALDRLNALAMPPAPDTGAPGAVPMPPPQSPLLPNTPIQAVA